MGVVWEPYATVPTDKLPTCKGALTNGGFCSGVHSISMVFVLRELLDCGSEKQKDLISQVLEIRPNLGGTFQRKDGVILAVCVYLAIYVHAHSTSIYVCMYVYI